jgi:hypothetical protein
MSYTKQQIEEYNRIEEKFCTVLPEDTPMSTIRNILNKLHRYETTLQRINENDCNGHPRMKTEIRDGKMYRFEVEDERWVARDAKKEASIQKRVVELLEPYNIKVQFNGDPRGGAIRMLLPDHTSNGWDGEFWGIYW